MSDVTDKLELALETARVGTWTLYIEEDKLIWDKYLFNLLGVDPNSFVPSVEQFLTLVHPED